MLVAVFGDQHAHAEALEAVVGAAERCGVDQLWSLGDMIGGGPDPGYVVRRTRERCAVALVGNHDYAATGSVDPLRLGEAGSPGVRSLELARERLPDVDIEWLRSRKPAARRDGVQCWHGSPRNPVWEYVGPSTAGACLAVQRAELGLVGHTHVPAAWQQAPGGRARSARPCRHGMAGGTPSTPKLPTGPSGCCSTSMPVPRPGGARPMTQRPPARVPASSGSTTPPSTAERSAPSQHRPRVLHRNGARPGPPSGRKRMPLRPLDLGGAGARPAAAPDSSRSSSGCP